MKKLLLSVVLAVVALTGCASGGAKSFSDAHESASKSSIEKSKARAEVQKTKYMALASTAKLCKTGECALGMALAITAVSGNDEMQEDAQPAIVAPVDPAVYIGGKLVDAAVAVTLGKFGLDGKLSDNSRSISAGDSELAKQINRSNTPVNPFATQPAQ